MGQVGLEWSVAGFGDFSNNANETDMLMRNSNTGVFELFDIRNNQITSAMPMGQVGLEWSVADLARSNNANETDMLMRNSNTGVFELSTSATTRSPRQRRWGRSGRSGRWPASLPFRPAVLFLRTRSSYRRWPLMGQPVAPSTRHYRSISR